MGQLTDIKAGIKTVLEQVTAPAPGITNVQTYRRAFTRDDDFIEAFKVRAPGGGFMVSAWIIEPPLAITDPRTQAGHFHKAWTFPITAYVSLNDRLQSENLLDQLMEAAEDAVLRDETGYTLNGSCINVTQVRTSQDLPLFFARYLCSVGTLELDVSTHRQYC